MPFSRRPIRDEIVARLEVLDPVHEMWEGIEPWHPVPDISEEFDRCDERITRNGWDRLGELRLSMSVPW